MRLFGSLHLVLLAGVAVTATALPYLCRRGPVPFRPVRLAMGWGLAANEAVWWFYRYSREGIHSANLPLQLCDLTVWLAVLGCLTALPTVVEFAYFAGIAGAGMALLTPNLVAPWPRYPAIYFFIAHGGIVVAVSLLAFGTGAKFRAGAVWRSFGLLLCYAIVVGIVNATLGSNYMFLARKPENPSILDAMGPWPVYLVWAALLALGLFWILWLPVRPKRHSRQTT